MNLKYSIILFVFLISGCAPRGFSPPPEPYEEFALKNGMATISEVKTSMIECGYSKESFDDPRPASIYNRLSSEEKLNSAILREECMFSKGYYYKSGSKGLCSDQGYRAKSTACQNFPIRP